MNIRMIAALGLLMLSQTAIGATLVVTPARVADRVYAVYGDLGNGSYDNEGLNANLGFVVGDESVMVVNTGPSYRFAKALHDAIRKVTSKPVKYAVNLNGQRYYWHGNDYFRKQGVRIYAQSKAIQIMRQDGAGQLASSQALLKDKADGTHLAPADQEIVETGTIDLGNLKVELRYHGNAHTPGDMAVWMPSLRTVFAGDIAFNERMVAVLPIGNTGNWIKAFDAIAQHNATIMIPGHGHLTDPKRSRADTRDYIDFLRTEAKKIFDNGGSLQDAVEKVDQSRFRRLANFDLLAGRNMNIVFQEIERESF